MISFLKFLVWDIPSFVGSLLVAFIVCIPAAIVSSPTFFLAIFLDKQPEPWYSHRKWLRYWANVFIFAHGFSCFVLGVKQEYSPKLIRTKS
jgi:hypothetical protein